MEADPREATFEEIVERDKRDRKGKYYATMERDGLKLTLYHSMNRSDQFDVIAVRPSRWSGAHGISELHDDLSMPKVIKLFSKVA